MISNNKYDKRRARQQHISHAACRPIRSGRHFHDDAGHFFIADISHAIESYFARIRAQPATYFSPDFTTPQPPFSPRHLRATSASLPPLVPVIVCSPQYQCGLIFLPAANTFTGQLAIDACADISLRQSYIARRSLLPRAIGQRDTTTPTLAFFIKICSNGRNAQYASLDMLSGDASRRHTVIERFKFRIRHRHTPADRSPRRKRRRKRPRYMTYAPELLIAVSDGRRRRCYHAPEMIAAGRSFGLGSSQLAGRRNTL